LTDKLSYAYPQLVQVGDGVYSCAYPTV